MITTFILNIAAAFFLGLASLTSGVATLPSQFSDALSFVFYSANFLTFILPIDALFYTLSAVLLFEAAIWVFEGSVWIYRHIPFIGH